MNKTQQYGYSAEKKVTTFLRENGFTIQKTNYKKKYGEIDIIACKNNTYSFIEVKARKNPLFDMAELVSYSKQKKIIAVAKSYIAEHTDGHVACQFDIVLVEGPTEHEKIQYIPNAFSEEVSFF